MPERRTTIWILSALLLTVLALGLIFLLRPSAGQRIMQPLTAETERFGKDLEAGRKSVRKAIDLHFEAELARMEKVAEEAARRAARAEELAQPLPENTGEAPPDTP